MVIDLDSHLYEGRDLWASYADPEDRHLAMRIVDDELGYAMLTYRGEAPPPGAYCFVSTPRRRSLDDPLSMRNVDPAGNVEEDLAIGGPQRDQQAGRPSTRSYDDLDPSYSEPGARLAALDRWGIEQTVMFPQWGLEFETMFFDDDLEGLRANLVAWNRWAGEVTDVGKGRLHPVGHLTLQGDQEWVIEQLGVFGRRGISLGFVSGGLINGKRPSHPDNDPIWRAFVDNGVTLTFHIGIGVPRILDRAWVDNDHITFAAMGMWAILLPAQTMLADFAFNGVFERHPDLRVLVAEHNPTTWLGPYLQRLDAIYEHQPRLAGRHAFELSKEPSGHILEHTRFTVMLTEQVADAPQRLLDAYAFSGDYPHCEGAADPLADFRTLTGMPRWAAGGQRLYEGNAAWALQQDRAVVRTTA